MQPPLTLAKAQVQLNLLTSQEGNFTFSSDELTQALQIAWNDTYVVNSVWDSSLTYSPGTYQYAIPTSLTTVQDLYITRSTDDNPTRIGTELYEIVAGNIQFNDRAERWLGSSYTIYIKGKYKLQLTDPLPTTNLINYVVNLAAENLFTTLIIKKTFVFLRNDTSISDIVNALKIIQNRVLTYKQALLREFESA